MEVTKENRFDISLDTKLWRYMSFAKFVELLRTKNLHLPSAMMFEDPYEGACGEAKNTDLLVEYLSNIVDNRIQKKGELQVEPDTVREIISKAHKYYNDLGASNKYFTFISCWHENETESEAMWKLYTQKQPEGVAIQTTFGALKKAINDPDVQIGRVSYVDYEQTFFTSDSYFWYKRKFFEHEREVRVIMIPDDDLRKKMVEDYKRNTIVVNLPIDLDVLIKNVYVSPYADVWFRDLVVDEMKRCNLAKSVLYSSLNQQPIYLPTMAQLMRTLSKDSKETNKHK